MITGNTRDRSWMIGLVGLLFVVVAIIMCACGCQTAQDLIDDYQDDAVDIVTPDPVTTTTTTQPQSDGYTITKVTDFDISWIGPNLDWAVRAFAQRDVDDDPMLKRIPAEERGDLCGESHLIRANGKGGKFDHIRRNTKWRDWKNIHNGYGVWSSVGEPADGEVCELWLVSYDGSKRVLVGTFKWVR